MTVLTHSFDKVYIHFGTYSSHTLLAHAMTHCSQAMTEFTQTLTKFTQTLELFTQYSHAIKQFTHTLTKLTHTFGTVQTWFISYGTVQHIHLT